ILDMELKGFPLSDFLIPPVSMMVAVENAVKHNEISKRNRLMLKVEYRDLELIFTNKISLRRSIRDSTKTGLANLNERFKKLTAKEIRIENDEQFFRLYLPLLKLNR
ncbi:MAG: hypothetical protein KFF73_12860, partial [Cyclobacteriaceae bacterium]|nr:hypothetical protein [Cyclobacteriaceae bacterium]